MDDHDHPLSHLFSFLFFPFCFLVAITIGWNFGKIMGSPPSTESSSVVEQVDPVNKVSSAEALTAAVNSKIVGKIVAIEVEGCEYLYAFNPGNGFNVFTHKGNCKNPVHLYNKEKE